MTDKYEMLKDFINELAEFKNDETLKGVQELIKALDKVEPDEQEPEEDAGNVPDFNKLTYTERVNLKRNDPVAYAKALAKEAK